VARRWLLFIIVFLAWPGSVRAAPAEEALELARSAETSGQAGDYVAAISLFKAAWALDPRVEYRCSIGVAYYRAKDLPRSHLFLTECLAQGTALPREFVAQVRDVLSLVEVRLATGGYAAIDLAVTPAGAAVRVSAFALDEPVPRGGRIWLPLGNHVVVVSAPGFVAQQRTVALTTPDPHLVAIDLVAVPTAAAPAQVAAVPEDGYMMKQRTSATGLHSLAVGCTVVTVIGVIGSIALYARAGSLADRADELSPLDPDHGFEYVEAQAAAANARGEAGLVTGLTVISAGVTGLVWWRWSVARDAAATVTPTVSPGGAGVAISGRF
jgi:hypothetical protein